MSSLIALLHFFFFETGSLTELRAHQFCQTSWLASPRDPPISPTSSSTLQAQVTVPGFLCGCSGLNSGPLDYIANISKLDHFPGLCCSTFFPCTSKKSQFLFHLTGLSYVRSLSSCLFTACWGGPCMLDSQQRGETRTKLNSTLLSQLVLGQTSGV